MTTTQHTIAEQTAELTAQSATRLPAEVLAAFRADQARLDAAGVPAGVAEPGTPMPDGDLLDVHGAPTTLTAVRAGRTAVVVFYRGAWCPYCNVALRSYQARLVPALDKLGVPLIAVSPQKPDGSLSSQESNELTFTVLSDPGNQLATALGILFTPSEESVAAQAQIGLDLPAVNQDGSTGLPMPAVAIVDAGGVLRWLDVHPNYTTRTETAEILDALREIS